MYCSPDGVFTTFSLTALSSPLSLGASLAVRFDSCSTTTAASTTAPAQMYFRMVLVLSVKLFSEIDQPNLQFVIRNWHRLGRIKVEQRCSADQHPWQNNKPPIPVRSGSRPGGPGCGGVVGRNWRHSTRQLSRQQPWGSHTAT